jgi:DNA repair exonuclease SbcCD nuclease subunit
MHTFGIRNDSQVILDNQQLFYDNVVFPLIDERNITTVFDLGDTFDRRKFVNFNTLRRSNQMWFDRLRERNIDLYTIAGNHTTYYKSTNDLNTLDVLYSNNTYNFNHYIDPVEVTVAGKTILLLPWISPENYGRSIEAIKSTTAFIAMGHLEFAGFEMFKGSISHDGLDRSLFSRFNLVLSGHFHHKSSDGNIHYLGAPSQYTWSDWDDERGVHILDLETEELEFIPNPYPIFHKFFYDDVKNDYTDIIRSGTTFEEYKGCYVKIVTINKENPYLLESIISLLEKSGVVDVQIVDNHFNLDNLEDSDIIDSAEDTLTILKKYTSSIRNKKQRESIDNILSSLYVEAQNFQSEVM